MIASHTLRLSAGRALLAVSRVLARHGARLIGHPSGHARVSTLRTVPTADVSRATDAANVHDIRRGAL